MSSDSLRLFLRDKHEPVFAEPWEAHAFALAVHLHEHGHFTWSEWSEALAEALASESGAKPYYQVWMLALENLLIAKKTVNINEFRSGIDSLRSNKAHSH